MKATAYLNCISYNGLFTGSTGSVLGIYDFLSGSGNALIYNQIYPSGSHFSGNNIYGPAIPLVSVGKANSVSGQFTGVNCYRFGFTESGDFGVILDIDYSGCDRNTAGVSYVLFSTIDNPTGSTGTFFIGINEANRLFIQTSGYYKSLNYELRDKNIFYVGLGAKQYVNFGIWDVPSQQFNVNEISLSGYQQVINKLYIGGFLNNTDINYTGYFGKINNAVLLNGPLEASGIKTCSTCLFATGITTGSPNTGLVYFPSVTGYTLSGVNEFIVTGYTTYSGTITKFDNSTINVIFPSGLTQLQKTQDVATALTGFTSVIVTGQPTITFLQDTTKLNRFIMYDIELDLPLTSGDTLEIYTFPDFNSRTNLKINTLDYPISTEPVQLIGNGLVETLGVDYDIVRGEISGFFEEDVLSYDLLTGLPLVSAYSGYWANDKIAMSGGGFFPSVPQFIETSGKIYVTGITGNALFHASDVFMNGQKLVSGYNYSMFRSGALVVLELNPTGLPALVVDLVYPSTGGLPTGIGEIQDAELSVIPNYGQFTRYLYDISGTLSYASGITGYSEEVWVNGVRQREFVDYVKIFSCTQNSGFSDPASVLFNFYNNDTGFFNIT